MTQTRTLRCWMLAAVAVGVGSASPAWAQGQGNSSAPAATTSRAAKVAPRMARAFYWWPAYRGMLPALTGDQAEKLDGIAASYGRLTRGLYLALRAKKLTRTEYGKRHGELRDDIERAKRAVLRPEQLQELERLETVWRMKLDAFRGIPNPYYAVQFTEEQLGEILSYRTGQYDPAIKGIDKRSAELAEGFAESEDPQERIAIIGHMADVEKQRKTVLDEFHEFIERMLKPDQFSAVRRRMLADTSSVRVKIDMQDWPPLRAIKTIAENGGVKLEIEPSARKLLETKGKTVNIRSSPVTPAVAIERVAGALGVRVSRRGDTLVLYLPQDGVSVVPSPGYGQGSVEVTPGTQMRLVRWRFGVRDILPRYNLQKLTKYLKSVSPKAEIELDEVTNTILVIMPERNVAAVKEAMNALRQ